MCRNHRGFVEATVAVGQAGRRPALPQHRLRRPAAGRRARAREARRGGPRRGVHRAARRRRDVERAGARPGSTRDGASGDVARRRWSRRTRRPTSTPAGAPRADRDPDLRHHRDAEGRTAQRGRHRRRGLAAVADAAALRLAHPHRGAAVPHLGLRAPVLAMLLGSTVVLRRKFDPEAALRVAERRARATRSS